MRTWACAMASSGTGTCRSLRRLDRFHFTFDISQPNATFRRPAQSAKQVLSPAQRNCSNTGSCLEREEPRSDACCLPGLQRPTRHLANDTMRGRKPGRNGNGREHEAHQPDPGLRPRKLPSGPKVHRHASVYDVPAAGYHAGLIQTWSEPVLPAISLPTLFRPSVSAHIAFDACTPDLVRSLCHP